MNWEFVEAVFAQDLPFTRASREEILDALSRLERNIGIDRIQETKASISSTWALGRLVEYGECFKTAESVTNGNRLKSKLLADYESDECQDAIAEALTAERLLSLGAIVQYEPRLPNTLKRPDLLATWGNQQVAFEVIHPNVSYQDVVENRKMDRVISECLEILESGTLRIYLAEPTVTLETTEKIIEAVKWLLGESTQEQEIHLSDGTYLGYSPAIHEQQFSVPATVSAEPVHASPLTDPAYREVKKKLKIMVPMYCVTAVKGGFASGSKTLRPRAIVMTHRPSVDPRAFGKAEEKHAQLPEGIPGVVVIDMSRTGSGLRSKLWAQDLDGSFGPGLHPRMSAVWLRSGQPVVGTQWSEWLIVNPHATLILPKEIHGQLIPGAQPISFG